jgi:hypothetical protein
VCWILAKSGKTGLTGVAKMSDQFRVTNIFSPCKIGLTGLRNRPDRFYSGRRCLSCFLLRVFESSLVCLTRRSSSIPVATWIWQEKFVEVSE